MLYVNEFSLLIEFVALKSFSEGEGEGVRVRVRVSVRVRGTGDGHDILLIVPFTSLTLHAEEVMDHDISPHPHPEEVMDTIFSSPSP